MKRNLMYLALCIAAMTSACGEYESSPQSKTERCTSNTTSCNGTALQVCVEDEWVTMMQCADEGLVCCMKSGKAECTESCSSTPQDPPIEQVGCTAQNAQKYCAATIEGKVGVVAACTDSNPAECTWKCDEANHFVLNDAGNGCICDAAGGYEAGEGAKANTCVKPLICDAGTHKEGETCVLDANKCRGGDSLDLSACPKNASGQNWKWGCTSGGKKIGDCIQKCNDATHYEMLENATQCSLKEGICKAVSDCGSDGADWTWECRNIKDGFGACYHKCTDGNKWNNEEGKCMPVVCEEGKHPQGEGCVLDTGRCTGGTSPNLYGCGTVPKNSNWSWTCSSPDKTVGECIAACKDADHYEKLEDSDNCSLKPGICNYYKDCGESDSYMWEWECANTQIISGKLFGTCSHKCLHGNWSEAENKCIYEPECAPAENDESGINAKCSELLAANDHQYLTCTEDEVCVRACDAPYHLVGDYCYLGTHRCTAENTELGIAEDLSECGDVTSIKRLQEWECVDVDENGLGRCGGICDPESAREWIWTPTNDDSIPLTGACKCGENMHYDPNNTGNCLPNCTETTCEIVNDKPVIHFCHIDPDDTRYGRITDESCPSIQNGQFACISDEAASELTAEAKGSANSWCEMTCADNFEPDYEKMVCSVTDADAWVPVITGPETKDADDNPNYVRCTPVNKKPCDCTDNYLSGLTGNNCGTINETSAPLSSHQFNGQRAVNNGAVLVEQMYQELSDVAQFDAAKYDSIKHMELALSPEENALFAEHSQMQVAFRFKGSNVLYKNVGFALINTGSDGNTIIGTHQMPVPGNAETTPATIQAIFNYDALENYNAKLYVYFYSSEALPTTGKKAAYIYPFVVSVK